MSRMTHLEEEEKLLFFITKAKEAFEKNPAYATFTEKCLVPGCLFAMRWGMGNDCILVFKVSEDFEPINFQGAIKNKEVIKK